MMQYKFEMHKKTLSYMSLQTLLLYMNFFIMTKPIVCNHRGWFIGFLVCYIIQEIGSTALEIVQIREQKKPIEYIKDIWNFQNHKFIFLFGLILLYKGCWQADYYNLIELTI